MAQEVSGRAPSDRAIGADRRHAPWLYDMSPRAVKRRSSLKAFIADEAYGRTEFPNCEWSAWG